MKLKISNGNSKLGSIPNLNLMPGPAGSCRKDVKCWSSGCYAKKALMYPSTKKAWQSNLDLYHDDSATFFNDLDSWLTENKPELFRVHSAGDMPDESYWFMLQGVMLDHQETNFLIFTKRYDFDYSDVPKNASVVLSVWPGMPLPTNTELSWAWLSDDTRLPEDAYYFKCPGGCGDCPGHICWNKVDKDVPVIFDKH